MDPSGIWYDMSIGIGHVGNESELGFYHSPASPGFAPVMPFPKPGDQVKVALLSGETIEGVVEWIDGAGAWVKGAQKSRWVPLEAFQPQTRTSDSKDDE